MTDNSKEASMSEIKPISSNEHVSIKTAEQRYDEIKGSETFEDRQSLCVMNECHVSEAAELRAAYEALQKENAAQAKRIAELENETNISDETIKLCSTLLAKIAITLKGCPMELARHSYHDLPELVSVLHLENELNKLQMNEMLSAMRRAVLALAFAAESSNAMKDDYQALSNAIDKAVSAQKGTE